MAIINNLSYPKYKKNMYLKKKSFLSEWGFWFLLALPWLLLAINADWFFNELGHDGWVYLGAFHHAPLLIPELSTGECGFTSFEDHRSTRLGWILPGYLFNKLLPWLPAHFVIHLSVYYLAVFSLYYILRSLIGNRTAVLSSAIFGSYFYFIGSVGWHYPDAITAAYCMLTFALVTRSCLVSANKRHWWLMGAGASFALMIWSYPVPILFAPIFFLYLSICEHKLCAKPLFSDIFKSIKFVLIGFIVVTFMLCIVNKLLGGPFLFFMTTIEAAIRFGTHPEMRAHKPLAHWIEAHWLIFPIFIIGTAIGLVLTSGKELLKNPIRSFYFFAAIFLFFLWTFMDTLFAEYVSFLFPILFLCLGASLLWVEKISTMKFLIVLSVALLPAIVVLFPQSTWTHPWSSEFRFIWAMFFLLIGIGLPFIQSAKRLPSGLSYSSAKISGIRPKYFFIAFCSFVIAFLGSVPELPLNMSFTGCRTDKTLYQDAFMRSDYFNRMDRTQQVFAAIKESSGTTRPTIWYNFNESLGKEFRVIAFGYDISVFGDKFPALGFCDIPERKIPEYPTRLVLLSEDPTHFEKAALTLKQQGKSLNRIQQKRISAGKYSYFVSICSVTELK